MKNYMKLIRINHPDVAATCNGDTAVYSNIDWHDPPVSKTDLDDGYLSVLKGEKIANVDAKTHELINNGFVYNNLIFSLSNEAQLTWVALKQSVSLGLVILPTGVSTKNDREYTIIDDTDLTAFYGAGLATMKTHLDSGRELKISIDDAMDETTVDAIEDTR